MAICISNGNRLNTSILMLPAGMKMNISMKSSDREERGGGPDGFISTPFGDGSLNEKAGMDSLSDGTGRASESQRWNRRRTAPAPQSPW